ncbi:MAG: nucleotidyl transferase AbiEii/AbiGii toxin family protein [Caldilineaceae bacterium]
MIIGAYAGGMIGVNRTTYDIDIIVDLREEHIQGLTDEFPPPRYYADPEQMRSSISMGIMFNIIDSSRGEKADLVPITMEPRYQTAFQRRIRRKISPTNMDSFQVWCARPEDIIVGKLMAWAEGRSRKHETDIYDIMVFHYLDMDPQVSKDFDERYIDRQAYALGVDVAEFWNAVCKAARNEAAQND